MSDNKNKNGYASLTGFKRAIPIILLALAAFTALCFMTQQTGALGNIISKVLLGLFARGAYAIPVLLALHAIFFARDVAESRILSRVIFSVTALLSISAVLYTVANFGTELTYSATKFYNDGVAGIGGGFIGNTFAFGIIKIFGHVGLIIIAAVILVLYVSFFFAKGRGAAKRSFFGALIAITKFCAVIERGIVSLVEKAKARKKAKTRRIAAEHTDELFDDEFFAVDNGLKELSVPALGIHETRSDSSLEENPTLQERVHHRSAEENFTPRESTASTRFDTDWGLGGGASTGNTELAESVSAHTEERSSTTEVTASERASLGLDCSADDILEIAKDR